MSKPVCRNCRFWRPVLYQQSVAGVDVGKRIEGWGECRVRAPTACHQITGQGLFPRTHGAADWCGEHHWTVPVDAKADSES